MFLEILGVNIWNRIISGTKISEAMSLLCTVLLKFVIGQMQISYNALCILVTLDLLYSKPPANIVKILNSF